MTHQRSRIEELSILIAASLHTRGLPNPPTNREHRSLRLLSRLLGPGIAFGAAGRAPGSVAPLMGSLIKKRRKRMRKKKHKKMLKRTRWQRRAAGK